MTSLQQHNQGNTTNRTTLEAPSFVPETSPIHGQQAWVVLDLYGQIVRSSSSSNSGTTSSSSSSDNASVPSIIKDAPILYKMLVESTPLMVNGGGLNRMTITFDVSSNRNADGGDDDNSGQTSSTSSPSTSSVAVASTSTPVSSPLLLRYVVARDEKHIYLIQTKGV